MVLLCGIKTKDKLYGNNKISCLIGIEYKEREKKNIRKKTLHAIQWQIKDPNVLTNDMPIRNPLSFYSEHMSPGSFIMYMQKA